ncbi:MAG: HypC/HybG/HupF family hydrogenase formation chaperone [Paenacidovorax caeni]
MQVRTLLEGHVLAEGPQGLERVNTALVGDCLPGEWVLVFLGSARERLSLERAAEVRSLLALVEDTLAGRYDPQSPRPRPRLRCHRPWGPNNWRRWRAPVPISSSQGSLA